MRPFRHLIRLAFLFFFVAFAAQMAHSQTPVAKSTLDLVSQDPANARVLLAQNDTAPAAGDPAPSSAMASPGDASAATPAASPAEPSPGELLEQASGAYTNWKKLGWLAGLVALVNLLINCLKVGAIKRWFDEQKKAWLIPYMAIGLGALLGVLSIFLTGGDPVQNLVAGVMAGLGAIGGHEVLTKLFNPLKRLA